jgi:hypothetical protein
MLEIKQRSELDEIRKLKIAGDQDDLRQLALSILTAIDNGKHTTRVGTAAIKIECR